MTDDRSRQPAGSPASTGGQFAPEAPKPDAPSDVTATSEPIVIRFDTNELAQRNTAAYEQLREARHEIQVTGAAQIASLVLSVYPTATRVRLGDSDQYDGHDIDAILDAHGNELADDLFDDEDYAEISDEMWEAVQDIPTSTNYLGNGKTEHAWYVEEEIEGHRNTTRYIDLAAAVKAYEDSAVRGHINAIAYESGNGTMRAIFDVIADREELEDEKLLALDSDDVNDLYEGFIAKSVDRLQTYIEEH